MNCGKSIAFFSQPGKTCSPSSGPSTSSSWRQSIVSNCHVRIAFAPNQPDTAAVFGEMTGTATQKATYNFNGKRLFAVMGHLNAAMKTSKGHCRPRTRYGVSRPPKGKGAVIENASWRPGRC